MPWVILSRNYITTFNNISYENTRRICTWNWRNSSPGCGENGTLRWVDEERQEIDAKGLDCLGYVRELRVDDYLSPTTLEEIAEEIKKKVNRG